MMCLDPVPWLMQRHDRPALRARRWLDLFLPDDAAAAQAWCEELIAEQRPDGSWEGSLLATAGAIKRLCELRVPAGQAAQQRGCAYLIAQVQQQPGSARRERLAPGALTSADDLAGFFGPYATHTEAERLAQGATEMNHYRLYEPLRGPQRPVRAERRSPHDRPGPNACYAWGLIPLGYTLEALALTGHALDLRLLSAWRALLAAQRADGGWCRHRQGHPSCSLHALGALSAHPSLYQGEATQRLVAFMARSREQQRSWWRGQHLFAVLDLLARLDLPEAQTLAEQILADLAPRQHQNGSFGGPYPVERAAAVVAARQMPQERERMCYL